MIQHNKVYPFHYQLKKMKPIILVIIAVITLTACSKAVEKKETLNSFHQSASLITISPEKSYTVSRSYLGQIKAKQHTNLSF